MKIKEAKKISKIVDELFLYFIKHGHPHINIDVKVATKSVVINMTIEDVEESILEKLNERINKKRELEVEEYGWELMGESDCSNELELIGLIIDDFKYTQENNLFILTFTRTRK